MGFRTKNDHFGVFLGYYHLRKQPYIIQALKGSQLDNMFSTLVCFQSLRFDVQISSLMVSLDFHVNVFFWVIHPACRKKLTWKCSAVHISKSLVSRKVSVYCWPMPPPIKPINHFVHTVDGSEIQRSPVKVDMW